jgi:hypothetical protein
VIAPPRSLVVATAGLVMAAAIGAVGCGGGGTSSSAGPALIEVETSSVLMTVRNQSGRTLVDVRVSIVPVGGATQFTATIPRMESGEKRNLSLREFRGKDGTPFDLRVIKPKKVRVSGTDPDGKTIEVERPWT